MRLDELFSRKPGVSVWTKTQGRIYADHGDGETPRLSAAKIVNVLVAKKNEDSDGQE